MTPVPPPLAEMDPMWFIEIPVCMCGGVVGGPIALLVLLLIRKPIARRLRSPAEAWCVGAFVGAGLGVLNFNLTFAAVLVKTGHEVFRDQQILGAVVDRVMLFTVGGGLLGIGPGMVAVVSAFHRERNTPAPS
jgi:hypothetical protein